MRASRVKCFTALIAVAILAGCSSAASPLPSAPATSPGASPPPSAPASSPAASPPPSAPAVGLAETLQGGTWRIVSATGISDVARLSPVEFRQALVVGLGVCGFASDVAYPAAGAIDFAELYWDSVICKDNDPSDSRQALKAILDTVTAGRVNGDGSVSLAGPTGEVVLSR